jgi:hypothetical protein
MWSRYSKHLKEKPSRRRQKQIQFGLHCEESTTRSEEGVFKRRKVMKRITSIALFALVSLVTICSASAQERAIKATVPFDFTVGSKLVPSGTYTITAKTPNVVLIQNGERSIALFSTAYGDSRKSTTGELVFNKYGDQYFLSEILCSAADMNLEIPTSKAEKRARVQEASLHNASQVLLALK